MRSWSRKHGALRLEGDSRSFVIVRSLEGYTSRTLTLATKRGSISSAAISSNAQSTSEGSIADRRAATLVACIDLHRYEAKLDGGTVLIKNREEPTAGHSVVSKRTGCPAVALDDGARHPEPTERSIAYYLTTVEKAAFDCTPIWCDDSACIVKPARVPAGAGLDFGCACSPQLIDDLKAAIDLGPQLRVLDLDSQPDLCATAALGSESQLEGGSAWHRTSVCGSTQMSP